MRNIDLQVDSDLPEPTTERTADIRHRLTPELWAGRVQEARRRVQVIYDVDRLLETSDASRKACLQSVDPELGWSGYLHWCRRLDEYEGEEWERLVDGLVTFRDHPPQDNSFVTRVAPPRGVESSHDGFPDRCPCGHHWYTQAESCREMGITVHTVGCQGIGSFVGAVGTAICAVGLRAMSMDAFRVLIVLVMLVVPVFSEPISPDSEESTETMRFDSRSSADSYSLKDGCLTIRSRRGIGEVTLTPLQDRWPPLHKLRFEYSDGGGMKVLEGLQLNAGSPNNRNDYDHTLTQTLSGGAVEVQLPPELPQSVRTLRIHWVDFYR